MSQTRDKTNAPVLPERGSHADAGEADRFTVEHLADRVRIRPRLSKHVSEQGASRWAKRTAILCVLGASIAWQFGLFVGTSVTYGLGLIVSICMLLGAQARAFRGIVFVNPTQVEFVFSKPSPTGGSDERAHKAEVISVPYEQVREIAVAAQAVSDGDDVYAVDVVTSHSLIQLEEFKTIAGAQRLAVQLHDRFPASPGAPRCSLEPRPHNLPLAGSTLFPTLLAGLLMFPIAMSAVLLPVEADWLRGLVSAAGCLTVGAVAMCLAAAWMRRSLVRHLHKRYAIEPHSC